jgi:hypothetical protein
VSIQINNSNLEARVNKALSKMPSSVRPSSKVAFAEQLIGAAIDALVKDKVITM